MRMLKQNRKNIVSTLFLALLISSCAKKLDEKYPENYERDYFSKDVFSQSVELETENASFFALDSGEEAFGVYAQQEKPKFNVKVLSAPKEIAHLFKDLKIEAPRAGEKIEIIFNLTDSTITAFMVIKNPEEYSESTQQLIVTVKGKKVVPIFEYSGVTYGNLEKGKNELNEETRKIEFKPNDKNRSSHLTFPGTIDARKKVGFDTLPPREILRIKSINNRTWTIKKLKNIFILPEGFEDQFSSNETFLTRVVDNKLYLYIEKKKAELSALEGDLFKNKDERLLACVEINQNKGADCVYKAILSHNVNYVKAKLKEENDNFYGQIELEGGVSNQITGLITYSLNSSLREINYDKELSLDDKELYRIEAINNKFFTGKELQEILGIISYDDKIDENEKYKIQIFDNTLLVSKKVPRIDLSTFEKGAVSSNDPRFEKCHESDSEVGGKKVKDCVYRPILQKRITWGKFKYEKVTGSKQKEIEFTPLLNDKTATHIKVTKEVATTPFKFLANSKFSDEIFFHKEDDFDLESEYVYVPMTHGTPRKVIGAAPFYQGTEKIVKLRFEKDGLEVYEPEALQIDEKGKLVTQKTSKNDLNNAPVLKIPGSFLDFNCAKNDSGVCTGDTTLESEKPWNEKHLFNPSLESLQVQELNSLDLFTVEDNPCVYKIGQKVSSYEIKKGKINIELEKTYKTSSDFSCIIDLYLADPENLSELSQATFKVRYNYSLVRLKDLESKNYEPVAYSVNDHGEFGFFKTSIQHVNDANDPQRQGKTYFINRWNPKKGVVEYKLNESFYKPENVDYLKMTETGINHINQVLKKAETGIEIKLTNGTGYKVGDLDVNTIVLIDDPLSNGLLGYAPTVANPRSGEILQGHVNMYPGNIRSMSRSVYESMVDLSYKQTTVDGTQKVAAAKKAPNEKVAKAIKTVALRNNVKNPSLEMIRSINNLDFKKKIIAYNKTKYKNELEYKKPKSNGFNDLLEFEKNKVDYFSYHCAYSQDFLPGSKSINKIFKEIRDQKSLWTNYETAKARLKRWKDLNSTERKWVADVISPKIYLSTFIHEMGHNLGLRHNFAGSFDEANYYTDAEAKELGLDRAPEYSSVMDYSGEELNSLTVFGKYDLAALRFGYARKVEAVDASGKVTIEPIKGSIRNFEQTTNLRLKPYIFCTDENAGLSPICNRFDEGSSIEKILDWRIDNYFTNYRYRNLRDERETFKKYSMNYYAVSRYNEFTDILDLYQFMADLRPMDFLNFVCTDELRKMYPEPCKAIDEEKTLFYKAGAFFTDILKTPDHTCTVVYKKQGKNQKGFLNFASLVENVNKSEEDNITTCFDPRLKAVIAEEVKGAFEAEQYVGVLNEGGTALNSIREQNLRFKYADDIGIRGAWVDRALAARFLFKRSSELPFKMKPISLFDFNPNSQEVMQILSHLVLRSPLQNPVPFRNVNGDFVTELYDLNPMALIDMEDMNLGIRKAIVFSDEGDEYLLPMIIKNAHRGNILRDVTVQDRINSISRLFEVKKGILEKLGSAGDDTISSIVLDGTNYLASEPNVLAQLMIDGIELNNSLSTINPELAANLLSVLAQPIGELPKDITLELNDAEKALLSEGEAEIATIQDLQEKGLTTKEKIAKVYGAKAADALIVFVSIKPEKLQEMAKLARSINQKKLGQVDEQTLLLLELDFKTIVDFVQGTIKDKATQYEYMIQQLPQDLKK